MRKSIKIRLAEWVLKHLLKPHEKVIIAQRVMVENGRDPDVQARFEKAFGVTQKSRSVKQWNNLVRVYGLQTVAKIESMTEDQVKNQCRKMTDQVKLKWIKSRAAIQR